MMGTSPQNKGECYNSRKCKLDNGISKQWEAGIRERKYALSPFMEESKSVKDEIYNLEK